jgi:hypothetical protein
VLNGAQTAPLHLVRFYDIDPEDKEAVRYLNETWEQISASCRSNDASDDNWKRYMDANALVKKYYQQEKEALRALGIDVDHES